MSTPHGSLRRITRTLSWILAVLLLAVAPRPAQAAGAPDGNTVLIHGSSASKTVWQEQAAALGFTVEVASDAQWSAKSTADFATYRAIVIPDNNCSGATANAVDTRSAWAPAVDGNILIVGGDPDYHAPYTAGATALVRNGIAFTADEPWATGAYLPIGCSSSDITILDQFGTFVAQSISTDAVHKVAVHPALEGLDDADLSNWGSSTHMGFSTFPEDFVVLAIQDEEGTWGIDPSTPGYACYADGHCGTPYLLVRGAGVQPVGLNLSADGPATVTAGDGITYTLTYGNTGGTDATGVVVTDPVPEGTTFLSASDGGALVGSEVVWNLGGLPAGITGRTLTLTVATSGAGTVVNTGYSIRSDDIDPTVGGDVYTQVEAPPVAVLTVTLAGSGSGTVSSSPPGIDCGVDCSETYDAGTPVTLGGTPAAGSVFDGFSGGGCSGVAPCALTMSADTDVTATFRAFPDISVADVSVAEGDSGTATATFTVTLSGPSPDTVSAAFTTTDGSATAGADYLAASGTVAFAPGETVQQVPVEVVGDVLDEADQTFTLDLSAASGGALADPQGTATILDDDPTPDISIGDVTVDETDGSAVLELTMTGRSEQEVTVDLHTVDQTALGGQDYTPTTSTVRWAPADTGSATVEVPIVDDADDEVTETFDVVLSDPANATISDGGAVVTITDDELVVTTVDDHDDGGCTPDDCTLREAITAANARPRPDRIQFGIPFAEAGDGVYSIWVGFSGLGPLPTITDPVDIDGTTQPSFEGAPVVELDGTFAGRGSSGLRCTSGASVFRSLVINRFEGHGIDLVLAGGNRVTGCYIGTDASGTLAYSNVGNGVSIRNVPDNVIGAPGAGNVIAGNGGSGVSLESAGSRGNVVQGNLIGVGADGATFLANGEQGVSLLGASDNVVGGSTPDAGNTIAFNNVHGVLVSSGSGNRIQGNSIHGNTRLAIDLSNDGVSTNDPGDGDDGANGLQNHPVIDRATGGFGTTGVVGGLSSTASTTFLVELFASDACDGSGFGEAAQPLVAFEVDTDEAGEASWATEIPTEVAVGRVITATATAPDGSTSELSACRQVQAPPSVSVGDAPVVEGSGGQATFATFVLSLSEASAQTVTVAWATADGTAAAGADYGPATGTVTFTPGQTSAAVEIAVMGDDLDEYDESFLLTLSGAGNCTVGDGVAEAVITDDDDPPNLQIGDSRVVEGPAGADVTAAFDVLLSSPSGKEVSVGWSTADGTATVAGGDYDQASGSVGFVPGQTTAQVAVTIHGDGLDEDDEDLLVALSDPVNATLEDSSGRGVITDDDEPPTLSVSDMRVVEGAAGVSADAVFTVSLDAPSGRKVTFAWATADATAIAPDDYLGASGTGTLAAGETSTEVVVTIHGDDLDEGEEELALELSDVVNAAPGDLTGRGVVVDDDADLAVTMTGGSGDNIPGQGISYTITASNPGNHNVDHVRLVDVLPDGLSDVSWTCGATGGAACSTASGAGSIDTFLDLPAGGSATLELSAVIDPSARGTLNNSAALDLPEGLPADPDRSNNSATVETVLTPSADLSVVLTDDTDPTIPGRLLGYSAEIGNAGPSDATGVEVVVTLPEGVVFSSASEGCVADDLVVHCDVGTVTEGASATVALSVEVSPDAGDELVATVSVTTVDIDPVSGNDSDTETTTVDGTVPTVTLVSSRPSTADGRISDCESVPLSITEIVAEFSEPMSDGDGATGTSDVTNPDHYLLVGAGDDRDLETDICGSVFGDDVAVPVDHVAWDPETRTVRLAVNGGDPLPDAAYRFMVCGSLGLSDRAGNLLDGDGDGSGGDDLVVRFRIDRGTLFNNGHLDCGIDGWTPVSDIPEEVEHSEEDADGASISGSLRLLQLVSNEAIGAAQCVDVTSGTSYVIGGRARFGSSSGSGNRVQTVCVFYGQPRCTGSGLGISEDEDAITAADDEWSAFETEVRAPSSSASAMCAVFANAVNADLDGLEVWLDQLTMAPGGSAGSLFSDSFESGATSSWSGRTQ